MLSNRAIETEFLYGWVSQPVLWAGAPAPTASLRDLRFLFL